ncbi:MAG: hypothetical protein ABF649_00565 [Bacillus sp. (in: firmicutes)]
MINKNLEFEFVHKDLYGVAIEVVKKFVGDGLSRPILSYALHTKEGDILATNSHKAIHIREIHGFNEDYLVNPKNYMFAKGTYPDLYNVIGSDSHKKSITLNKEQIKLWLQLFKSINNTLKMMKSNIINKAVKMSFLENSVTIEVMVDSENSFKTILPTTELVKPDFDKITFSVEMMRDALEAHFKLNSELINIYFHGQMRPIIMNDESIVKTIILPVRTY